MSARRILLLAYLAFAVQLVGFVICEITAAGRVGAPIDDGWIYMAFARALAEGEGITYPGHDGPLCAVTGPVWNACLALGFWLFGATALVAKGCGALTGFVAIHGSYRLGRVATGDAKLGAVAALLLAATARFAWGSLSIMEVPFYVATVTFGLALHLERRHDSLGRWLPALVILLLSGWARPECFVFPMLAALDRRRIADLGVALVLLGVYPAYHLWIYGHPLPTTFYAKAVGGAPWSVFAREGAVAALQAVVVQPIQQIGRFVSYLPTFLPILALGLVPGILRARRERSGVQFVALALLAFVVARGVLGVAEPWFQYGRYFAHVHVMFVIVAIYGFDATRVSHLPAWATLALAGVFCAIGFDPAVAYMFDWWAGADLASSAETVFWVALATGVALTSIGAVKRFGRPPILAVVPYLVAASVFGSVRNGWNVRDTYAMNVAMAELVVETVPEGELVACHDIGALGFFANRPMLDLAGLGSPEVVFRPRAADGSIDAPGIVAEYRPRWLCLTESMAAAVFPPDALLPGFLGAQDRGLIEFPDNVTLLGSRYRLIELSWQD